MTQPSTAHAAKVIAVTVAAAVGGFLFGFDSSVINGAVDSIEENFALSSFVTGFAVAIALLGCAVGAWFAGRLADRWGRKRVMMLGSVLFVVSSAGSGLAFSVPDLMLWRVLGGLGIGIASVIAPTYISEIAPARYRGSLASLQQLAITLGIFAALLSDAVLQNAAGGASNDLWWGLEAWRWMFLVGVVPAAVYGILAVLIPESPRYLVGQDLDEEAAEVLANVTGELEPEERVREIRLTLRRDTKASFGDIRGPVFGLQSIVWVGITMAIFQQFVGINAIFYYSTTLWQSVGFTENESFTTSVITALINVVMTFVAILFVDKVGRRPLLMGGSLGMFVEPTAGRDRVLPSRGRGRRRDAAGTVGRRRTRRRERLRHLLRRHLGPHHVGHAGRDVPEPNAGSRARYQYGRELDREFHRDPGLPAVDIGGGPVVPLRIVRVLRVAVVLLRQDEDPGDQGNGTRGHADLIPGGDQPTSRSSSASVPFGATPLPFPADALPCAAAFGDATVCGVAVHPVTRRTTSSTVSPSS